MKSEPVMNVGIIDRQREIEGRLNGNFYLEGTDIVSGPFSARAADRTIILSDGQGREIVRSERIRLAASGNSTFTLMSVVIGNRFHWERTEDQTFQGSLILMLREDATIAAINEIPLESYLQSVISSEMSATSPMEFLKAHAIISRSWLISTLDRKNKAGKISETSARPPASGDEIVRWYEQEEHDLYDVCADDHCQRYQGITKIVSDNAKEAVRQTEGTIISYKGIVCDARYYKACGGLTEDFATAWEDIQIPYLVSISDAPMAHPRINTEEEAARWMLSEPEAYCNVEDSGILEKILPDFDRETKGFFRWKVEYAREELEQILRKKSGFDFGVLKEIQPIERGPSGRIFRLKITGTKKTIIVGKELEIRRWLSTSHLYSSAFIVITERDSGGEILRFIFKGAGWGHGVGLCQIGAAVMADKGFNAEEILKHYFTGSQLLKIY